MTELKVGAFIKEINLARGDLAWDKRKVFVVETFNAEVLEALKINGPRIPYTVIVDGVRNAKPTSVKEGGVLVALFNSIVQAIIDTIYDLTQHSPKKTGRYSNSHIVLINGIQQKPPYNVSVDDIVTFTNLQPYARKIERGLSSRAPNGVYELVARLIRQQYGSFIDVKFTYRSYTGSKKRDARFPTIVLKAKGR